MKFSEFIEQVCGIELLEYQRIYMDAWYLKWKELGAPEKIIYSRNSSKYDFQMMAASMMAIYEKEIHKNEN